MKDNIFNIILKATTLTLGKTLQPVTHMTTMSLQRIISKRMSENDNDECIPECPQLEF